MDALAKDATEDLATDRGVQVRVPLFEPGERIAGRYVVVRLVGQGGMGDVYEAVDEELGDRVALKTVCPELATDDWARVAFKREIHLARKVTHPNVCRIFDLGFHGDVMFLSMEYLGGETLGERLRREGRLPPARVLPVLAGIAAGLDAAHRAGVVHGDLKPTNVMLVAGADGERVVVTDFGLATWRTPPGHELDARDEPLLGSPAFMSRERLEGEGPTAASDLFSLGVLLHRAVTGALPFPDVRDPLDLLRHRARAISTRDVLPELDRRWDRVIRRCTAPLPEARPRSAAEVCRALAPGRSPWAVAIASAVVVVALTTGAATVGRTPSPERPARPAIAVLGFRDLSSRPDLAWVSTAIGEMLTTELGAGGSVRVAPGDRVARVRTELGLHEEDHLTVETARRLRAALGAEVLLVGSYFAVGDRLRLDLRLQDAETGDTIAVVGQDGNVVELTRMVGRAARVLRRDLGLRPLTAGEEARVQAALPLSSPAARHHAQGVALARRFEFGAAILELERAVAAEPTFAAAHAALADAHWFLGDAAAARASARRALELSEGQSEEERLVAQARYWQTAGEISQQIAVLETLWRSFPDNLDHGIELLLARLRQGDNDATRQLLAELRALPSPARDDPRLDVVEMRLTSVAESSRGARARAERVLRRARAQGAWPIVVEAQTALVTSLWTQGELDAAIAMQRQLREVLRTLGDAHGQLGSRFITALILADAGRLAEAAAELGPAPAGTARGELVNHQHATALLALERDELAEARAGFLAERDAVVSTGAAARARARPELGLAYVALRRGELDDAEAHADRARRGYEAMAYVGGQAYALTVLGDVALARGQARSAAALYRQAREIWRGRDAWLEMARLDVSLAGAALAAGDATEAAGAARRAMVALAPFGLADDRALAAAALARALLAQGRVREASDVLVPVLAAAASSERPTVRATVNGVRQRLRASGT